MRPILMAHDLRARDLMKSDETAGAEAAGSAGASRGVVLRVEGCRGVAEATPT
jgi:hypothetical protein